MSALELVFAEDHPAAQGHFPGNPIIPGAVLLSETLHAVGTALCIDLAQGHVHSAKFLAPARPGDHVDVRFSVAGGRATVTCFVADRQVLKAEVACEATPTAA